MSLKQHRAKVVLFRVAEREHETLADLCAANGGRRRSEYLRVALLNPLRATDLKPLRELIRTLDRTPSNLEGRHTELVRSLRPLIAALPDEGSPA
jgi:hypothetical protein